MPEGTTDACSAGLGVSRGSTVGREDASSSSDSSSSELSDTEYSEAESMSYRRTVEESESEIESDSVDGSYSCLRGEEPRRLRRPALGLSTGAFMAFGPVELGER